jgi:hypothetical protein
MERYVDAATIRAAVRIADPRRSQARLGRSAFNTIVALAACRRPLRLG